MILDSYNNSKEKRRRKDAICNQMTSVHSREIMMSSNAYLLIIISECVIIEKKLCLQMHILYHSYDNLHTP